MIYLILVAFTIAVGSLVFFGFKSKREYIATKKQQVEQQMLEKELRDRQEELEREREINELVENKLKAASRQHGEIEQSEKSDLSRVLGGSGGRRQGWGNN